MSKQDANKTKKQLIRELEDLRQRIAESEGSRPDANQSAELLSIVYDALNSSASGVIVTNLEGKIIYVNPSFLRIFGYEDKTEILRRNAADLFTAKEIEKLSDVRAIIDDARGETEEFFTQHKDGTIFPVEVSYSNVTDHNGNAVGRMASFIDITVRKRLEKELRDSERKLRHLSQRLLDAQEEERKRIAHELHDGLGATLTNIKYSLEQRLDDIPEAQAPDRKSLEQATSLVQSAIKDISRVSRSLRPSILDDMGVLPAIQWFCRDFQEANAGIQVEKLIEVQEEDVHEQLKIVIYRIIQEALTNVAKHSKAERTTVSLIKAEGNLELVIEDNGRGFDPEEAVDTGMGLTSMRERTEFSGGSFWIESRRESGTTIHALWPIR